MCGISEEGKTKEELAKAGVQALADFVKETGMPVTFREMGITDKGVLKKVADSCNLTAGAAKSCPEKKSWRNVSKQNTGNGNLNLCP